MTSHEDAEAPLPEQTSDPLERCAVCGRATPFTVAVLAGLPLGQICTCALELRVIERQSRSRRARLNEPGGTVLR